MHHIVFFFFYKTLQAQMQGPGWKNLSCSPVVKVVQFVKRRERDNWTIESLPRSPSSLREGIKNAKFWWLINPEGQGIELEGQGIDPEGRGIEPEGQGIEPEGQRNKPEGRGGSQRHWGSSRSGRESSRRVRGSSRRVRGSSRRVRGSSWGRKKTKV